MLISHFVPCSFVVCLLWVASVLMQCQWQCLRSQGCSIASAGASSYISCSKVRIELSLAWSFAQSWNLVHSELRPWPHYCHARWLDDDRHSATMNQLYFPALTAEFLTMLAQNSKIPVFTITNNVVSDLLTFKDDGKTKTMEGVSAFLRANRYCSPLFSHSTFVVLVKM